MARQAGRFIGHAFHQVAARSEAEGAVVDDGMTAWREARRLSGQIVPGENYGFPFGNGFGPAVGSTDTATRNPQNMVWPLPLLL